MEHTGQLLSVAPKETSKGIVYEAECGSKKFSTWREEVANKAVPLIGKLVTIRYESKPSGKWENNTLFDIAEANGLPQDASRDNATSQVHAGGQVVVQSTGMPPERESRIVRRSSMKIAFDFVATLYAPTVKEQDDMGIVIGEAQAHAEVLAAQIYKLAWGGPTTPEPKPEPPELDAEAEVFPF